MNDSSTNHLKEFFNDYCLDDSRNYENKGFIFEKNIPNVGFYALGKIENLGNEELIFLFQNIGTDKCPDGFNKLSLYLMERIIMFLRMKMRNMGMERIII